MLFKLFIVFIVVFIDMTIIAPFMISHRSYELPMIWIFFHLVFIGFLLHKINKQKGIK